MAEPIVRKFVIDTTESEQNLKELNVQIQATDAAINSGAQSFENVAAAEQEVVTSTKSLKAQLRELQAQLANTEPDSAKYRELAAAAGELKDRIGDAAEAVGTQAGGAFERVSGSLGLVTSRITNLDFTGAAEGAKLLASNISTIKPGDIAKGIQGIGTAFASIGKALLTNPIFLIGAAIVAAIVYAEELLTLVDGVTDAELEQLDIQKQRAAQSKQQLDAISDQENILRLQGKTEREILQIKIAQANQAILDQKAVIQTLEIQRQQQIDAAERNRKIVSGIIQFLTLPLQILLGSVDTILLGLNKVGVISDETFAKVGNQRDKFNKDLSTLAFDPAEVAKEGDKAVAEQKKILQQLENQQAGFQLSVNQIDQKGIDDRKAADEKAANDRKTANEKASADRKSAAEKEAEERLKAEQEVSDLVNQLYEENVKEFEEAEKRKTAAAEAEAAKRKKAEEDYDAAITALRAEQDAKNLTADQQEIIAIDNKYLDLREKAIQAGQSTVEVDAAYQQALDEQEKVSAERRIENEKAVQDAKIALSTQALSSVSQLIGAFAKKDEASQKRAFRAQKAVSIAQATIDTYASANAAFLSTQKNPVSILFPAAPYIAAGAAVAAGIANVATISKQQFTGGTPPSTSENNPPSLDGGGGGGGAETAQFNPFASAFLQDRPEQVTPRAYVLAGDVASQQEVRVKVEDLSRIG
jgi:hypothetical protein